MAPDGATPEPDDRKDEKPSLTGIPQPVDLEVVNAVFKRDDVRGLWPNHLTASLMSRIAEGFVALLRTKFPSAGSPCVAVACDGRTSSQELLLAFCEGVARAGGRAVRLGLASTEYIYFAAGERADRYDGAAMITASHNPKDYNGVKMVLKDCVPLGKSELDWIKGHVVRGLPELCDVRDAFADRVLELSGVMDAATAEEPLVVVVEAGNGMGAQAFAAIAARLDATGKFRFAFSNAEPKGDYPNGVPNPVDDEYKKRLSSLVTGAESRKALRELFGGGGADLGVCFDGDADRAGFVDHEGADITPSEVCALVAARLLANKHGIELVDPGPAGEPLTVMQNQCCSKLLDHLCGRDPRVDLMVTAVGHGKIKLLMRHYRDQGRTVVFAGEHSGHYFYPEFHYVDSGMLTTLHMLAIAAEAKAQERTLRDVLDDLKERARGPYCWSGEVNFTFDDRAALLRGMRRVYDERASYLEGGVGVRIEVKEIEEGSDLYEAETVREGEPYDPEKGVPEPPDLKVEVTAQDGQSGWWLTVRPSGNEPKLRLNVEAWGVGAEETEKAKFDQIRQIIHDAGGR